MNMAKLHGLDTRRCFAMGNSDLTCASAHFHIGCWWTDALSVDIKARIESNINSAASSCWLQSLNLHAVVS